MKPLFDANNPEFLLGVMQNFEDEITRAQRRRTTNVELVRDLLMSRTNVGGRTSSYQMCEYLGIDGDAFTFYKK